MRIQKKSRLLTLKKMSSEETKDSEPTVEKPHSPVSNLRDTQFSLPTVFRCDPDESLGMDVDEDDTDKGDKDAGKTQQSA